MGSGRWVQADGFRPLDLDGMADPFYASRTFPKLFRILTNILTVLTLEPLHGVESQGGMLLMKKKYLAIAALSMALAVGSAMTSFAAGFVHTSQGTKYQWGSGDYCTNNWVNYKNHWFFFGEDQIMRTGWIQKDGTWYYAADTGELQGGIMKINGNVYYFDSNSCKLQTGERTFNGQTHTFTENGTTDGGPYVYTEWNSNGTLRRGTKFGVR